MGFASVFIHFRQQNFVNNVLLRDIMYNRRVTDVDGQEYHLHSSILGPEGRFLYENQCFFEKWCFTEARASLLKVRVRFRWSLERPKSLKSDLGEGQKRAIQNIMKI